MKETVASFWYTKPGFRGIGKLEILCIKSFLDNGYKFILYTYNKNDKIFLKLSELFSDFELKDANEIVLFSELFYDDAGAGLAAFSDYFRFRMINKTNLPWVDLDIFCLNKKFKNKPYIFIQELNDKENFVHIGSGILKFEPNSPYAKKIIQNSTDIVKEHLSKAKKIPWGVIGPILVENSLKDMDLDEFILDYRQTSQISYFAIEKFISDTPPSMINYEMPLIHLYNDMWRQKRLKKDATYDKNSFYEKMCERHEIYKLLKQLDYKIGFFDKHLFRFYYKIYHKLKFYERAIKKFFKKLVGKDA